MQGSGWQGGGYRDAPADENLLALARVATTVDSILRNPPDYNNYFASLKSERRRDLAREVNWNLITMVESKVCDRLAGIPELAKYACFAADGHWHKRQCMTRATMAAGWPWDISTL